MQSSFRQFWVDIIGPTPWGTHFCMFYQTKGDLLDILIPYFKEGLENNEYCMWVTSEPLNEKDAEKAMRAAIPNFDKYLQKNQIEIIPYTEWYVENNEFDSQRVLNGWVDKCNYALDNGFKGLRLTGNTFWLEDKDWKDFTDYEEEVNNVISSYNMIAVCTYSLEKCGSLEILDVVRNHQYALFRREGSWEIFKSSEQTKIEQKLKESEEKHRVFMETAKDFMHIIDSKGKIIYANRDFIGYKKEELINMHITELIAKETLPIFAPELKNLIENGSITLTDLYCKGKEGTKIIGELTVVAIYDTDGNFNGARGIFKDITERNKIEQKLKESEEKWRALTQYSPDHITLLDSEANIMFVNYPVPDLTYKEVIGKSVYDFIPEEYRSILQKSYKRVLMTGEPDAYETAYIDKFGNQHFYEAHVGPLRESEKITKLIVRSTEITDRKMAEQKLKDSETKLRGIMNLITDQVCILDRNLDILYINGVAEEIYGPSALGSKCYQIYHGLDEPCSDCQVRRTFEDSEVHNKECIRRIGEESRYCWCVSNVFERDEEGRPISVIEVSRDTTERKKIEQELKESEEKYKYRYEFENLISRLSLDFINSPSEKLDELINRALKKIAKFTNAVRSSLFICSDDLTRITNTNEWCADPKDSQINMLQDIPFETFGYYMKFLKEKRNVIISNLDDLPADAKAEIEWIKKHGFRSLLFVPIINNNKLYGSLGFYSEIDRELEWSEDFISLLKIFANVFVSTILRKQSEERLRKSEEKWRALSENSPAHVLMLDREHKIIFINRTVPDLSKEEVIGTSIYNYTPQEFHQVIRDCYSSVWETGEPSSITTQYITKEGDIRYFDMWVGPVFQSEKVVALITHSMDITERKKKEEEIRLQSEIIENMSEGVCLIKLDNGTIVYTNPAFEEMFGYDPGEMVGKNIAIVNAPTDKTPEETKEDIMRILSETGEWHGEVLNIKKDGTPFWCYANVSLFDHPEYGTVIVSVHTDITERKKIEQELKESEHQYRTTINNLGDPMHVIDKNYKIILVNEALEQWVKDLNLDQELIGKTPIEAWPFLPDFAMEEYCSIFNDGNPIITISRVIINNREITTETRKIPIFEKEKVSQIITIIRDITERKEVEQKLKESEHNLGERVKELTCLYKLSKLVENPVISLEDIINGTLDLIPPAWQFPDITTTRITYDGREYKLGNFEEAEWKLSTIVEINEKSMEIEVFYLEDKPFLEQEHDLINEIGIRLKTIFEEKEVQKKLQLSEDKYRTLFESGVDGIASADMEGNLIDANKAFLDMLGYSKDELLNLTIRQLTPSKWHEMEDDLMITQLSEVGGSRVYEKEYITKDGTIIPINIRFWVVKDDQDDPSRQWAIVRDITERKKAEEEITNLAKFPSENPNPVLRTTREKVIYANKKGESLFNVKEGEKIPSLLKEGVSTAIDMGTTNKVEIELNNCIYSLDITPIVEEGYANVYGMDITERKKAEEEMANLAKFPSENPYPVLRVDNHKVIYVNNSGKYLLNVKEREEIPKIIQKEIHEAYKSNSVTESEVELKNRIYSFIITPLLEKGYVNIYGMDITEKKQVEQKLKEINKLKSEFLRRASHELKTPLISIKGFSDLILALHRDQINPDVISKLDEINQGCERLQNIINNLLTTSRLESPDIKPKVQREDLTFLIKFCVHELQSLAQTRNQTINLDIHDGQYAFFEKEEIHDVISNLLTNAIKYTPPGGKIDVKTDIQEENVVISIKDNGIGFTNFEKTKIFQQFGKIERYGQGLDLGIDGTGLGLYISKRIIESHGGKIWMESEGKNQGSTFYFSLPLIKD